MEISTDGARRRRIKQVVTVTAVAEMTAMSSVTNCTVVKILRAKFGPAPMAMRAENL
jgi:hypothetical protein